MAVSREKTTPRMAPTTTPPTASRKKRPSAPGTSRLPAVATPIVTVYRVMATPSLIRLSPSAITARRVGAPTFLNTPTTATGSVAATMLPNSSATGIDSFSASTRTTPTIAAVAMVPGTARNSTGRATLCSSRSSRRNAASNSSGGSSTNSSTRGSSWGRSSRWVSSTARPPRTSATAYGTPRRRASMPSSEAPSSIQASAVTVPATSNCCTVVRLSPGQRTGRSRALPFRTRGWAGG